MTTKHNYLAFLLIAALILVTNCALLPGGGDDESKTAKIAAELQGTWRADPTTASVPINVSPAVFENLSVSFILDSKEPGDFQASGTYVDEIFNISTIARWDLGNEVQPYEIVLSGVSPVFRFNVDLISENDAIVTWDATDMSTGRAEILGSYSIQFRR